MTKKKAISILRKWRNIGTKDMTSERLGYIEGWFGKDDSEAFAMAIKALEERKEGFWQQSNIYYVYSCPFCKNRCTLQSNYCPSCGAKLDVEY